MVALLLGVGGTGVYFATDIISPPVKAPPASPMLNPTDPAAHADDRDKEPTDPGFRRPPLPPANFPGERPAADPKQRITDFVNAYDGGDCFFVLPATVADGKATLEGFGSSVAPFEVLDYEFKRQNGSEASIGVHQVMPEQCPAVSFLSRTRNQRGLPPRLDINAAGLKNAAPLTGTIAEFGDRHVELLLVADDGYVHNLSTLLKQNGNTRTFSIGIKKTTPPPPTPQLLFAIVSSKPLEALRLPQLGSTAEQVFSQVLNEALQTGQSLNVSAKYFMLEN